MHSLKHTKIQFDKIVIFLSVIVVGLLMIWGNPFITLVCFIVLFFAIYFLGYRNIPPVLLFIVLYHWLQSYTSVVMSNYIGQDIDHNSENASLAVLLSMGGILIMIFVYNAQIKKITVNDLSKIKNSAQELSATNILILYIIFYFLTNFLSSIAFSVAGLTQIIYSL
ncbi:MAG: hypothetical protein ACK5XN_18990, partial [Bacteroidota bacterium]